MSAILLPEKAEQIRRIVKEQPMALTISVARQAGVTERDVFAALEGETAWALDASRFGDIMHVLGDWGNVMVIVKNAYAVMESFGELGGFSNEMGYFNIKTEGIDMHIKPEGIAAIYLVNKPAHTDGMPTHSVQFFDPEGQVVFKVFLTTSAATEGSPQGGPSGSDPSQREPRGTPKGSGRNRPLEPKAQAAYEKLKREFLRKIN